MFDQVFWKSNDWLICTKINVSNKIYKSKYNDLMFMRKMAGNEIPKGVDKNP